MKKSAKFLVLLITVFSLALFGCEGDDGDDGPPGPQGPPGPPGEDATVTSVETCTLCHDIGGIAGVELFHPLTQADAEDLPGIIPPPYDMTINSVSVVGGDVVVDFTMTDENGNGVAITPGTNRLRFTFNELIPAPTIGGLPDGPDQWLRYAYIRPSNGGILTGSAGNYTFNYNSGILGQIVDSADVFRVAGQLTGSDDANEYNDTNWVFDYNFDGVSTFTSRGGEPSGRDIATTAACNDCHEALAIHGGRYEYKYCVACHNPDELGDVDGDMVSMVHLIHSSTPDDPKEAADEEWETTYPADLRYCSKCHAGPNADLGLTRPYADACGSCHSNVNFETGEGHLGGPAQNNATCTICHPPDAIVAYHAIDENAFDFAYEVNSVEVDENNAPVVTFTITLDGTPIETCPPAGPFIGSPNFKVGYAVTAEGVENPIDYNNFGNGEDAAQPVSIGVCDVIATATANADGSFTATLPTTYPAGANYRTVGIDGYFYWTKGTEPTEDDARQYTDSGIGYVTGDDVRRMVVDNVKCLSCHEQLAFHGGNRVNKVELCVVCHNPNLSSSGHEIDPTLPEDSQNLKDLVHGIHAAGIRNSDFEFARNFRGNANYYNFSEVTYPADISHCYLCHNANLTLPGEGTLASTVIGNDRSTPDDDLNISPISASCYYCHDADFARAHMQLNGGAFGLPQSDIGTFED